MSSTAMVKAEGGDSSAVEACINYVQEASKLFQEGKLVGGRKPWLKWNTMTKRLWLVSLTVVKHMPRSKVYLHTLGVQVDFGIGFRILSETLREAGIPLHHREPRGRAH